MGGKAHRPEQIIHKLRQAEVELSQGATVPQAAKEIGVTAQTYYRWRTGYGGLRLDQAKRLLEEIGSEYVGIYFDVGNFVPYAFPEQWIEMLGRGIKKVHFKDFRRRGHQSVPLLEGAVDWRAAMKALRNSG